MKNHDISQTPLVRRFGVRGAKLFARIWFTVLYLVLVGLVTKLWLVSPEASEGPRRLIFGGLVGGFAILATVLLTKMRLEYWSSIQRLNK